jgi:hypothetical protein
VLPAAALSAAAPWLPAAVVLSVLCPPQPDKRPEHIAAASTMERILFFITCLLPFLPWGKIIMFALYTIMHKNTIFYSIKLCIKIMENRLKKSSDVIIRKGLLQNSHYIQIWF